MTCVLKSSIQKDIILTDKQYYTLYGKFRNQAITVFIDKLNEKYPNLNITREQLFDKHGKLYSYEKAKPIFDALSYAETGTIPQDKRYRDDFYNHYNAFQHTFIPALFSNQIGALNTVSLGILKESRDVIFDYNPKDAYKDLNNNNIGAMYGELYHKGEITLSEMSDIIFNGAMKKNRNDDNSGIIPTNSQVYDEELSIVSFAKLSTRLYREKYLNLFFKKKLENYTYIPQIENNQIKSLNLISNKNSNNIRTVQNNPNNGNISYLNTNNGYRCKFFDGGGAET